MVMGMRLFERDSPGPPLSPREARVLDFQVLGMQVLSEMISAESRAEPCGRRLYGLPI